MKQVAQERIIITNHTRKKTTNGNSTITRIKRVESSIKRTITTTNRTITDEEAVVVEAIAVMDLRTKVMERIHSLMITVEVDEEAEEEAEVDAEASNRMKEAVVISSFKLKTPILLSIRKLARMEDKVVTKLTKDWTSNSLL